MAGSGSSTNRSDAVAQTLITRHRDFSLQSEGGPYVSHTLDGGEISENLVALN